MPDKQLSILFRVTRHDVMNQLTAMRGYLDLLKNPSKGGSTIDYVGKLEDATDRIMAHTEFTKEVETMGTEIPNWMPISEPVGKALSQLDMGEIEVQLDDRLDRMNIFCKTMVWRVFYNLLHNTLEHAGCAAIVSIYVEEAGGDIDIVYEDNGSGIPEKMKRRILSLCEMYIREEGEDGARFVIHVPSGRWMIDRE